MDRREVLRGEWAEDYSMDELSNGSGKKTKWRCQNNSLHLWQAPFYMRMQGSGCPYCQGRLAFPGESDLATTHPDIALQWHPSRNSVTPKEVRAGSNLKAWWQCSKGHEWQVSVNNRTNSGSICPYCAGKRPVPGENDLGTTHPELITEWSDKNTLPISAVMAGTNKKTWWKCKIDPQHEWEAPPSSRALKGSGCPYCSGRRSIVGENDLATTHPQLLNEWSDKNTLSPTQLQAGSDKKIIWVCSLGHEWRVSPKSRTRHGNISKCPYCSGQSVLSGYNDLATTHPDLAEEWHPTKNSGVSVTEISAGSTRKVWWQCRINSLHEWDAVPANRSHVGAGCPICAGKLVLQGVNDLATLNPELVKEWHPYKNNDLVPNKFTTGSKKNVWWQCQTNNLHEWQAEIGKRSAGAGCPYCTNRYVLKGDNDLATTHPELAKEWHPKRNTLTPEDVTYGSDRSAWWICSRNPSHEWQSAIKDRHKRGCPSCSKNNFSSRGEKELASFIRSIAAPGLVIHENYCQFHKHGLNELDIYLPSQGIAIEYNGLYWHSEVFKDTDYHLEKYLACKRLGIQLIQIWEDDWADRNSIVKRMIAHKLGLSKEARYYARQTTVQNLSHGTSRDFLNKFHIQGESSGKLRLGLYTGDTLLAVAIFRAVAGSPEKLELSRYATSAQVVGGLGKILGHLSKNRPSGITQVITFADHCVSDGGLYQKLGFKADKELPPDYMYKIQAQRVHKFNYRIKRFRTDSSLVYVEGQTEKELAQVNNILRIYDAGKTRYVLNL
jgi:hypothetical protein